MWGRFFPKLVKIEVDGFMEKDSLGKNHCDLSSRLPLMVILLIILGENKKKPSS